MNVEVNNSYPSFENRDLFVDLGEHIAFYRKRANLTQAELAKRVNITRAYLSRIETSNSSQSFSLELLFNISRELNVPLKYFFEPFPTPERSLQIKKSSK
jgi:transcriptional regulator with XRE-family HTH domain